LGRRRRGRKSVLDDFFDMLYEMTGYFWQVGAVATALLLSLSFSTYQWVDNLNSAGNLRTNLTVLIENYGWILYLLPLIILVLAFIFGIKTYDSYRNGRY